MKFKFAVLLAVSLGVSGVAEASPITYYIVDYPAYQTDSNPSVTDHVSGTIIADPTTGAISSASFTLSGASGSYTCDSAIIDSDVYVHITPTEITIDRNNPTNSNHYGNLGLRSGSVYPIEQLTWYFEGDPFVPGNFNYDSYFGEYKTGKTSVLVHFAAGTIGDSMVIAEVPEPATLGLLVLGGLGVLLRRRRMA